MNNSDFLVLRYDNSTLLAEDRFGVNEYSVPGLDTDNNGTNNVVYVSGGRNSTGWWDCTVKRPLAAIDPAPLDRPITEDTTYMSFATGLTDAFVV